MAEKNDKKPEASKEPPAEKKSDSGKSSAATGAAAAKRGLFTRTPVLLGGAMIIEAAVLFAGFKFLGGGPKGAHGAELAVTESTESETAPAPSEHGSSSHDAHSSETAAKAPADKKKIVAVKVLDFKAPNKVSGRTFFYDLQIYAQVKGANQKSVEEKIKDTEPLIQDRVRTIIAQSDPEKLGGGTEPGLETLRRQIKYQLEEIIGDGLVDEVLIPRCTPFRTDF